jgi:hypothetical protein
MLVVLFVVALKVTQVGGEEAPPRLQEAVTVAVRGVRVLGTSSGARGPEFSSKDRGKVKS